jgi:hypothetical protein
VAGSGLCDHPAIPERAEHALTTTDPDKPSSRGQNPRAAPRRTAPPTAEPGAPSRPIRITELKSCTPHDFYVVTKSGQHIDTTDGNTYQATLKDTLGYVELNAGQHTRAA